MRRLVAALVMAAFAVALVACGGTPSASTSAGTGSQPGIVASSTATTSSPEGTDTLSPVQRADRAQVASRIDETPDVVITDLKSHMPMMLYFYDPTQPSTSRQNKENDAAITKYRGTVDYLSFNVNAGVAGSGSSDTTQTRKASLFAANMGVTFTPYMVFVDSYGRVVFKFNGFTDRKLIEREILRATGQ